MKTHDYLHRRIWYDTHLRMWTLQCVDSDKKQVGDVAYVPTKELAFSWLRGKPTKGA